MDDSSQTKCDKYDKFPETNFTGTSQRKKNMQNMENLFAAHTQNFISNYISYSGMYGTVGKH